MKIPDNILLPELEKLLEQHKAAFQNVRRFSSSVYRLLFLSLLFPRSQVSRLEKLVEQYGIKVTFCPKFHCDCNAIEDVWAHQKHYVRKYSDQHSQRCYPLSTNHE